ncbi:2-hydroxychromene-2-carboxylate isomerase [Stagnihabitans tardus]|uniref:2-hydroxychromene-2-carboxylate isomerase n=1 Tax=Stagnihabitans tardus TaxID=2699202 RepID=A0AAE4YBH4_9RHOB|nr:2-hydroxychromene-2-carboxylate isomerase [Stagnihabitans tardus]NBZ88316.1 2-hydroxychromene-2-carboxylate isomerase [Stagnihabitans tardus]
MPQIDYYLALQSPYVYLAGRRPWEIAARHGYDLVLKPVDVAQLFPRTGGKVREERHPSRKDYAAQDRARQARKLGLRLDPAPLYRSANPAPAAYALIAAQKAGGGDLGAYVQAITRGLWAEGKDHSDDAVIGAALAEAGFDPKVADRGMLMAAETYAANLEEAVSRGVFGVPFFVVGEEKFWGQDRLEDLDLWISGK